MSDISYHNHTRYSDGKDGVNDMVEAAKAAGIAEFGLSDHLTITPFHDPESKAWSLAEDELDDYFQELAQAKKEHEDKGFQLRFGIEVDYFPENAIAIAAGLREHPLDYIIGSVHYVDRFPVDHTAAHWEGLGPEEITEVWRQYWQRIIGLARSGLYDIVGHLDLPKKFSFYPSVELRAEEDAALAAIRDAHMLLEINSAGLDKPCAEAYPSLSLLQRARALGIPVMAAADAHRCDKVKCNYAAVYELMERAGYDKNIRWRFQKRQRQCYSV